MQFDIFDTPCGKMSLESSQTERMHSDVSWQALSAQMLPYCPPTASGVQFLTSTIDHTTSIEPLAGNTSGGQTQVWLPGHSDGRHGGFSTLNTSDSPNDAVVCLLSSVLQPVEEIPPRLYLSAKACKGILRRAKSRSKVLPEQLMRALAAVAEQE